MWQFGRDGRDRGSLLQAVMSCEHSRLYSIFDAELSEDARHVVLRSPSADSQRGRDFRVIPALCHKTQNLELARGESVYIGRCDRRLDGLVLHELK